MESKRIAILLRGHERNVFETPDFSNLLIKIIQKYNVDVYIHTWSTSVGEYSWKPTTQYKKYDITEDSVTKYFKDIVNNIKNITIDDEKLVELYGTLEGRVCNGPSPKIAWKRMWYGKYKGIKRIFDSQQEYFFVMNMRFDILKFEDESLILKKMEEWYNLRTVNQIYFLKNHLLFGIDNCYMGNIAMLYVLFTRFHQSLESIEKKYPETWYTEYMVYYESLQFNYEIMVHISRLTIEVQDYKMNRVIQ